jgi:hypothetical protein
VWEVGGVRLTAAAIRITAGGVEIPVPRRAGELQLSLSSDPGDERYRTLEATWFANGKEQRLNVYFAADQISWWVSELRTYDDRLPQPEWITYRGPLFRTPIGGTFRANVSLGGSGRVAGTLTFVDLTLEANGLGS